MEKPKVLILGKIEHAHATWAQIAQLATIITPHATNRRDFIAECRTGALAGVSVAYRTFDSTAQCTGPIDAELLTELPPTLRFICHNGAGYDSVDVVACSARGIRVSNAPTAVDDATADMAVFLLLGALRNVGVGMSTLRQGNWRGGRTLPALGHDPRDKVLGILGMGGIGRNMARKAAVFGMRVRYHNRSRLEPEVEEECGAVYVSFEELLAQSDVLSLNLPLNPKTHHIISTPELQRTKPGVVIVNTARGAVMDEAALVAALDSGHVASAGLDVYEDEPTIHPGLLANPRVLLVPHMGTWTVETQTKMEEWTLSNVRLAVGESRLRSIVPEQRGMYCDGCLDAEAEAEAEAGAGARVNGRG